MERMPSKSNLKLGAVCFVCNQGIKNPTERNRIEGEYICGPCKRDMMSSLEVQWKKYSAFLDSALN